MATTINTKDNPLAAYGYDANTGQQLAQSLGMTTQQLADALATTPVGPASAPQTTSYGMTTGGGPGGRDIQSTIQQLQLMQAAGAIGGGNQQSGPPSSQAGQVSNDPMNAAVNLGAAALGMPAIYNPTPGQIPKGSKGGIAQVASPVSSGSVPSIPPGPWSGQASVFGQPSQQAQGLQYWASQHGGGTPDEAAAIEKANGWPAGTVGNQFYQAGVQTGAIQPLNAGPATGGTPTPTRPANAAPGGVVATPWATAPPAPGVTAQPAQPTAQPDFATIGAQNAALENAGKAMYAHFGGDPNNATHADIAHFHNTLQTAIGDAASAIGGSTPFGAAPPAAQNYTAGIAPGVSATGATPGAALGVTPPPAPGGPPKMAAGGFVPGRGSGDTVPALLTPGEYVIPKQQAAQLFGGRAPVRMADGGFVPGDPPERKTAAEARHAALVQAAQGAPPAAMNPSSENTGSSQSSNPSPSSGDSDQGWQKYIQQARTAALNSQGASGGGYNVPGGGYIGQSAAPGQSGFMYPNQAAATAAGDVGVGAGGGLPAGTQTQMAAGAISDLANGLTKAAQTYAASFKPWQIQSNDIGMFGRNVVPAPTTQFQQDQDV
jgi:hypothetical protein